MVRYDLLVEMLAVISCLLVVITAIMLYAPHWWIGVVIVLAFTSLPAVIPQQVSFGGYGSYLHEVPLFLGGVFVLLRRPANRNNDFCAAIVGAVTVVGALYGILQGNDLAATVNDARGLIAVSLCILIVGRIFSTPEAEIALRAIRFTLWLSFVFILLGAWGIVTLSARSEDASLIGEGFRDKADVTRVLGQTTHLASATVGITLALWAIRPDLFRKTLPYFLPAFGITVLGFSRNGLVLIGVTLVLAPLFNSRFGERDEARNGSGAMRALGIILIGGAIFAMLGVALKYTAGIPGLDYLRLVYSAYANRVLEGLQASTLQYDNSSLYRLGEVEWLKRAIVDHELVGNGFGFRYRPAVGSGFAATSGTYYAHQFYWWAIAKVGWFGLIAYLAAFTLPIANALLGGGRFALRSASGAAALGCLITITVAPLPEDAWGAPAFGALLGIAMLRGPLQIGDADHNVPNVLSGNQLTSRKRVSG